VIVNFGKFALREPAQKLGTHSRIRNKFDFPTDFHTYNPFARLSPNAKNE